MRIKYKGTRVDYATAKLRALTVLDNDDPHPASRVAQAIWPDADFKAQGAGGAASRILKRMEREGLARWTCLYLRSGKRWGWVKGRLAND
jgi:hypothetical protein